MRTDDQKTYFPGGRPGWLHYSQEYALEQLHYGEDVRAAESQEFIAQGSVNNALCFIGPHRVYSPWSATYQELIPGQGHFGPDALPGVRLLFHTFLVPTRMRTHIRPLQWCQHDGMLFTSTCM